MSGDLVGVELFVWLTMSFDPLFANFKLRKRLWEGKKRQHQDVDVDIGNQP